MIFGVEGSPRRNGNSHKLLEAILPKSFSCGERVEHVHLRDYRYDPCIGCERCRKDKICTQLNDGMTLLYPKLLEAKGLVLVSPVHNYNVTAWMKAFIDRLYCFYDFDDNRPRGWASRLAGQGRKAVIAAIGEQADRRDMGFALEAMRMPLEALGFEIVAEIAALQLFDRGAVLGKTDIMERARLAGRKLFDSLS